MARPTIIDLQLTDDRCYWPSLAKPGRKGARFEPVTSCNDEDHRRVCSSLRASDLSCDKRFKKNANRLAHRLAYRERKEKPPKTPASSRYMRRKRNSIFSQVWRLVDRYSGKVTTATLIKRGWEFTPEELDDVDVDKLLKSFLADLDRRGACKADGWLVAFLHGEWETPAEIYRLHVHMVVAGAMIGVIDRLREGRNYKYVPDDNVRFRVRIDRKPLSNLPYPLTYCLKAYWPWKHVTATANGKRRTRRHKRIPEPQHTQVLLFLDKYELSDLAVLKHVSVKRARLKLWKLHGRRK